MDSFTRHRDECRERISLLCERQVELKKQAPCASIETDLSDIRMKLKVLRREVRLCEDIETDSRALEEKRAALWRLENEKPQRDERRVSVQHDRQSI